jgi:plastocyanin
MNRFYTGISTILVAAIVIIVIVVLAASALYVIPTGKLTSTNNTTTTSPSEQSTNSSSSSNLSSSTSTSISASSSSSNSKPAGQLLMEFTFPATLVVSPDLSSMNYTVKFDPLGSVPTSLVLSVISPPGVSASFAPENLTLSGTQNVATLHMSARQTTAPGNYQFTMVASGNGSTYSQNETIEVVKYLVVTIGSTFVPRNLTVTQGGTVTWLRLNGVISQYDNGAHNVVFSSGISAVSPTLDQYSTWTYTFSQTGNFSYYCKYHPFMTGGIAVV